MLQNYSEDDLLIYIGDGASDFCPVEKCDLIFAKGKLSKYCNENNIPHYNFHNFFDIMSIFNKMFIQKTIPIKIRNQAFVKRKLIFEIE
jgi:2-hydroxy-3-keto-5-methylthiopentenyl-1-phosphate phosphatase